MMMGRVRPSFPSGRPAWLLVALGAAALGAWLVPDRPAQAPRLPDQHQSPERLAEIASLQVQRQGRVRIAALPLHAASGRNEESRHRLVLHSPTSTVEDTDIRGLIDGEGKYVFNQGTAYHMRLGRRFGGARDGEFELKRSLVRWILPKLPRETRVVTVRATFWVEALETSSPLATAGEGILLHVFAYPTASPWNEGRGGVRNDDFSAPAPTEATWMEARSGELGWPMPGALALAENARSGYAASPVALGLVTRGDTTVTFEGAPLASYVQNSLSAGSIDLLLKLEDSEEDRWGTEIALLTSNFGTDLDVPSRRPSLELVLDVPGPPQSVETEFVLEPGMEHILPGVRRVGPGPVIFDVEVSEQPGEIPPTLLVRGGDSEASASAWTPLADGRIAEWSWWQAKLVTGGPLVTPGDTFSLDLHATWVSPGPRTAQVPELALVSPSGETHFVNGADGPDLRYRMTFVPEELGLWRYGWSFRPTEHHPVGSQVGQGTFFVGLNGDTGDSAALSFLAAAVGRAHLSESTTTKRRQSLLNSFLRAATFHRTRHPGSEPWVKSLVEQVRLQAR